MPPRKSHGLSAAQLEELRAQLAEGRRPRVTVTGPQFPAGSTGTVIGIGDLASDGPDFVRVRVKVGASMDELPFAPAELQSSVRVRAGLAQPNVDSTAAAPAVKPTTKPTTKPASKGAPPRGRTSKPAKVTITITSEGADWSVSASAGARTVVKKAALRPGAVTAIAKLVGETTLTQAVSAVNDNARSQAQARASVLRAELDAVEALLEAHKPPPVR